MSRAYEVSDVRLIADLAKALKQLDIPTQGSFEPTEVRIKLYFEDEPIGLSIRLDGSGENYVIVFNGEDDE